ncbi:MAG: hypothetical protein ABIY70_20630 [Capsulimonas sp.]
MDGVVACAVSADRENPAEASGRDKARDAAKHRPTGITVRLRSKPPAPAFSLKHAEHLEDDDDNDDDSDDVKDVFVHIRTGRYQGDTVSPTYLRLARPDFG